MLNVIYAGQLVGAIAASPKLRNTYEFNYYDSWIHRGIDLAPFMMPIAEGSHKKWSFPDLPGTFQYLPGLLSDSLPDTFGNRVINAYMTARNIDPTGLTPIDRLAYMGSRAMGALEFEPSTGPVALSTPLELKGLTEQARKLLVGSFSSDADINSTLCDILQVGISAGGARPKAVVAWNQKTHEIRSGQLGVPPGFEHWLIKFDGLGNDQVGLGASKNYGRLEYAYHLMALGSGIEMQPCLLLQEGGRAHFATKRFDREADNTRHHIQTLCALQHLDYNQARTNSYEQFFLTVAGLKLDDKAMQEAYRRMAFNIAARNTDDHTKNIAFRMAQDRRWALAPAYDLSYSYRANNDWAKQHQLSVNGKFEDITIEDMLTFASRFYLPDPKKILEQVNGAIADWSKYAAEAGVSRAEANKVGAALKPFALPSHKQATTTPSLPVPPPKSGPARGRSMG